MLAYVAAVFVLCVFNDLLHLLHHNLCTTTAPLAASPRRRSQIPEPPLAADASSPQALPRRRIPEEASVMKHVKEIAVALAQEVIEIKHAPESMRCKSYYN